jgi:hypothetical protein
MSHFTVLVIGEDPEKQLAPFHEFECTGIDDEYVQDIDVTAEALVEGLDYHGLEDRTVTSESEIDKSGPHKYGYAIVQNGELVKAVNRTNPNRKWDWYSLGGRWRGQLKLKTGKEVDQARKGDVDFWLMRETAAQEAALEYDRFHAVLSGRECPKWDEIRERHGEDIDAARKEYNSHSVIKDMYDARFIFIWDGPEEFLVSREEFMQAARNNAVSTFAVIKDGKWYERGQMGWFGFVSDEKDNWNEEFFKLLDGLPDDTLLSVYDCHI